MRSSCKPPAASTARPSRAGEPDRARPARQHGGPADRAPRPRRDATATRNPQPHAIAARGAGPASGELDSRGVVVKQVLKPAEVIVDATLLSSLLHTLLDWALRHACSSVEIQLDTKSWPAHARAGVSLRPPATGSGSARASRQPLGGDARTISPSLTRCLGSCCCNSPAPCNCRSNVRMSGQQHTDAGVSAHRQ